MDTGIKLEDLKDYQVGDRLQLEVYDCKLISNDSYLVDIEIDGANADIIVPSNRVFTFMVENYEMMTKIIDGEKTLCVPEYDDQGDILFCIPHYEYFDNFRLEVMQDLIFQTIAIK